jgi:hypothetical protein
MARRFAQFCLKSNLPAMCDQPGSAGLKVLLVLWLGRNAGKAQIIAQLRQKTRLALLQIIENRLHVGMLNGCRRLHNDSERVLSERV